MASSLALPLEMLRAGAQHAVAHMRSLSVLAVCMAGTDCNTATLSGGIRVQPDCPLEAVTGADLVLMPSCGATRCHRCSPYRCCGLAAPRRPYRCADLQRGHRQCFPCRAFDGCEATTLVLLRDLRRHPRVLLQRRQLVTRAGAFYCAASQLGSRPDPAFRQRVLRRCGCTPVEGQFSPEIRRPLRAIGFRSPGAGAHPDETIRMAQDWMLG
ncbi:MAG: hypothetical protein H7A12_08690 [Pseudomonadales bacterium]|nr:hypothetical protein [Pseudomonadales bacterium]